MSQAQQEQSWTYTQRTGQLRRPDGQLEAVRGYSGWNDIRYRNNPDAEDVENFGPLPRGIWRISDNPPQDRPTTGRYSIRIDPEGHNARGRTNFYIHGESSRNRGNASRGCPVLSRTQREAIYNSGVRRFNVVDEQEWQ